MNKEDYCSYELSKKLKAAWFDWPCDRYYFRDNGELKSVHPADNYNVCGQETFTSAPTLYHAQKWLRETKHMEVNAFYDFGAEKWRWYYGYMGDFPEDQELSESLYDTYEAAIEAGIKDALEIIKATEK